MRNLIKKCLVVVVLSSLSMAKDVEVNLQDESSRIHSVKKVIATGGEIEQKSISVAENFKHMFIDGKVTGQVRLMYSIYYLEDGVDTYATAVGGQLKYELAEYNGFNAAIAFATSHDINFMTGSGAKFNSELSSQDGDYTTMSEAYINYTYNDLNIRMGRQVLDTPLADSDDIRMIANSFEAYVLSYEVNNFSFMAGNLQEWQGSDTGLNNGWIDTGKDGTWFCGISYNDELINANIWYYDISESILSGVGDNQSLYIELGLAYSFNDNIFMHSDIQFLKQSSNNNGVTASNIYGFFTELLIDDLGINFGYNKSNAKTAKASFSGFGGGALYTNMDNMVLDNITEDRDSSSYVAGLSYSVNNYRMLYAYAHFLGKANSSGITEHIVEQNMGVEYSFNDDLAASIIYIIDDYKDGDPSASGINEQENFRFLMTYNF